ncbi:glutamate ABC transporter substrate-binding protein [Nocardia colli]|uniref:glutamate ABC transporter substrate-binding protein n=1 Tax=Nocardia colli TaxID=2545717 RepID=UPI0035DC80A8
MDINRRIRIGAAILAVPFIVTLTAACGRDGRPAGGALDHVASGQLTIGIEFDVPGLGVRDAAESFSGFDVEVAKYVAGKLGVGPDRIIFRAAPPAQRETMLENGAVDLIVAGYGITDQRMARVDFAGPYYIGGQSLLVRADNSDITGTDSLTGKTVCSAAGSPSAQHIGKNFPDTRLRTLETYSLCVDGLRHGSWDAVTTDDLILAGYAAQSAGAFKLVGKPFTTESYGIGLKKGDQELREKINDAIEAMIPDGSWEKALSSTAGATGYQIPRPPNVNRY